MKPVPRPDLKTVNGRGVAPDKGDQLGLNIGDMVGGLVDLGFDVARERLINRTTTLPTQDRVVTGPGSVTGSGRSGGPSSLLVIAAIGAAAWFVLR